jgi:hypothetical protein
VWRKVELVFFDLFEIMKKWTNQKEKVSAEK